MSAQAEHSPLQMSTALSLHSPFTPFYVTAYKKEPGHSSRFLYSSNQTDICARHASSNAFAGTCVKVYNDTGLFKLVHHLGIINRASTRRKNNVIILSTMVLLTVITSFNILWHGRPHLPRSDFSILHKGGASPLSLLI